MRWELRDDIDKKDILRFLGLLVGLTIWTIFVFYSGCIISADDTFLRICT